jgi:hypothetical protein
MRNYLLDFFPHRPRFVYGRIVIQLSQDNILGNVSKTN